MQVEPEPILTKSELGGAGGADRITCPADRPTAERSAARKVWRSDGPTLPAAQL